MIEFYNFWSFELLLFTAVFIDLLLGDPRWVPHPVRLIGILCEKFELFFRGLIKNEKTAGVVTVITIIITTTLSLGLILLAAGVINHFFQVVLAVLFLYLFIAIKDLFAHSKAVYSQLALKKDIAAARKKLSYIVGRDTESLSTEEVSRACVETVAENMVDGITAPLFWAVMFSFFSALLPIHPITASAIGMAFYKSINTMDSMFGYKNKTYINFGWAAAKIDDIVNYLPARLSGLCIITGAFFGGYDYKKSAEIFFRDKMQHTSPNAGHSEAAVAGALNLQLGGVSNYFGRKVEKPTIGDRQKIASPDDIISTNRIVLISSLIFMAIVLIFKKICIFSFSMLL